MLNYNLTETGKTQKEVFHISWIDIEDIDKLTAELGIKITNETTPIELFDSVKQLIVAATNKVDREEIIDHVERDIARKVNSI